MNDSARRLPADVSAPVETLYEDRWLSRRKRGRWEYAQCNNPGGAVIILPVTPDDKVMLVEQYRVPIWLNTIEMPADLLGDLADQVDEGAPLATQREFGGKAGYRCERVEFVDRGLSSSVMSTETITFVRAWGLHKVGSGGSDETGNIVVQAVPRRRAGAWLFARAAAGY